MLFISESEISLWTEADHMSYDSFEIKNPKELVGIVCEHPFVCLFVS